MSLTHMLITGVFFTLVRALHDLCALAMAFRVAPGSTVQVTLSSRTSLHYQAAGGDTPTQHPTTIDDEDSAERTETDFIEFTRKTYEDVYKTTFAAFPGLKEDVQEVVNDVYAAIWTDWRKHSRKDAERLRRYATKAARNRTISRIRTAKSAERALDRYRRALAALPARTPRAPMTTPRWSKPSATPCGASWRRPQEVAPADHHASFHPPADRRRDRRRDGDQRADRVPGHQGHTRGADGPARPGAPGTDGTDRDRDEAASPRKPPRGGQDRRGGRQ